MENNEMLARIRRNPFLAFAFACGVVLWSVAAWVGVGTIRKWPGYSGVDYGGGIVVALALGILGLMLIALALKPGWKD